MLLSDHHVGSHTGDVTRHRNLMAAAQAVGVRRVVAQSIAFIYAEGPRPHREGDPLDASEAQGTTIAGVARLEDAVLRTPGIDGIVLRYGRLYGPGPRFPPEASWVPDQRSIVPRFALHAAPRL